MEVTMGMACKDFAIIAADTSTVHSILVMKDDEDKVFKFSDHMIAGVIGSAGDTTQFAEYIAKNVQLYKMRNGYSLKPSAIAHFTRYNLADFLRSSTPYMVNMILGGYDEKTGGEVHYIDYLASAQKLDYAAHGYGGIIITSIMARYWRPDLTVQEAYSIYEKCVAEIQKRLVINMRTFSVYLVDKNGITKMDPISMESLINKKATIS